MCICFASDAISIAYCLDEQINAVHFSFSSRFSFSESVSSEWNRIGFDCRLHLAARPMNDEFWWCKRSLVASLLCTNIRYALIIIYRFIAFDTRFHSQKSKIKWDKFFGIIIIIIYTNGIRQSSNNFNSHWRENQRKSRWRLHINWLKNILLFFLALACHQIVTRIKMTPFSSMYSTFTARLMRSVYEHYAIARVYEI